MLDSDSQSQLLWPTKARSSSRADLGAMAKRKAPESHSHRPELG